MDNIVEWAAGNVSIWETATRGTIDKINSTAVLLAGWNYNDTSAESDNEAYARQLWSDSNATLAAVMEQGKEGKYLKVIVDDARSKLDMASDELNRLIALVSTLEGNEAYLATWMDNVRENVAALNDSIATLKVNLTAVNRLINSSINSSAVVLSSARERLNASDQLLMSAIPKALESLDASLSAAEAQSERCTQLLADAANHTRELQQQGAQIRRYNHERSNNALYIIAHILLLQLAKCVHKCQYSVRPDVPGVCERQSDAVAGSKRDPPSERPSERGAGGTAAAQSEQDIGKSQVGYQCCELHQLWRNVCKQSVARYVHVWR